MQSPRATRAATTQPATRVPAGSSDPSIPTRRAPRDSRRIHRRPRLNGCRPRQTEGWTPQRAAPITMQTPAMATRRLVLGIGPLALPLLLAAAASAQGLGATVVSIGDGDTIRVRQANRTITVRLACIDAPETFQSPWGQQARRQLQSWLPIGGAIRLKVQSSDRYGRTVAEVISDRNINLAMVERGQAFAYRRYLGGCDQARYLEAEAQASRLRLGIWQVEGGISRPWDIRRDRRSPSISDRSSRSIGRYRCREIGSHARAQDLLRQGHAYLDGDGDGEACESLR